MTGRAKKINTDERKLAASLFNHVWDLMEKKNRTIEENDRMIHAAHASRYHWGNVGEPVNLARGEWQVSRVYSTQADPNRLSIMRGDLCKYARTTE